MSRAVMFTDYGDPGVLRAVVMETPEPRPGEVRVRVKAAGVQPADCLLRSGVARHWMPARFPRGLATSSAASSTLSVGASPSWRSARRSSAGRRSSATPSTPSSRSATWCANRTPCRGPTPARSQPPGRQRRRNSTSWPLAAATPSSSTAGPAASGPWRSSSPDCGGQPWWPPGVRPITLTSLRSGRYP